MRHGYPTLWIYNCDAPRCFRGAAVMLQNQSDANLYIKQKGWILGEKDYCPKCAKKTLNSLNKQQHEHCKKNV